MPQGRLEMLVRDEPCRDHPSEEWLTIKLDGLVLMEICTGALKAFARSMRGKDMIGWADPSPLKGG